MGDSSSHKVPSNPASTTDFDLGLVWYDVKFSLSSNWVQWKRLVSPFPFPGGVLQRVDTQSSVYMDRDVNLGLSAVFGMDNLYEYLMYRDQWWG